MDSLTLSPEVGVTVVFFGERTEIVAEETATLLQTVGAQGRAPTSPMDGW